MVANSSAGAVVTVTRGMVNRFAASGMILPEATDLPSRTRRQVQETPVRILKCCKRRKVTSAVETSGIVGGGFSIVGCASQNHIVNLDDVSV